MPSAHSQIASKFAGAVQFTPEELHQIIGPDNFADQEWLEKRATLEAINVDLEESFDEAELNGRIGQAHNDANARRWLQKATIESGETMMELLRRGDLKSLQTVAEQARALKQKQFMRLTR